MFLGEEKLLSIEGKVLETYKNIAKRIITLDIHDFIKQEVIERLNYSQGKTLHHVKEWEISKTVIN